MKANEKNERCSKLKIGLMHFRVGETDGVSLEMEKWKKVLEKMDHQVYFIAGDLNGLDGFEIPSISMKNKRNEFIHKNAFEELDITEEEFQTELLNYTEEILNEMMQLPKFDTIIVNNIMSLGYNLAAAMALTEYCKLTKTKLITHNHDFYWERERYSNPTCDFVKQVLESYFPPKIENSKHITINKLAQNELKKRKGIDSVVIPNVFEFNQKEWTIDDYNSDLRQRLGIRNDDIVVLHATRIVERKAIEIALDFVEEFSKLFQDKSKIHLVLSGFPEKESVEYYNRIISKASKMPYKVNFIHNMIRPERKIENKEKYYSFWDAYAISDVVTYTSVIEGWGNQLIEAVFAKKPLVIIEYPVYKSDIKELGFEFISLGDKYKLNDDTKFYEIDKDQLFATAHQLYELLHNKDELNRIINKNFEIGKANLSLESLAKYIESIIF